MPHAPWRPLAVRLPDAHLPNSATTPWTCRRCEAPWPCTAAQPYLTPGKCTCGTTTYRETDGPRTWHPGPRCYTPADTMTALAEELHQQHDAHPHYPPSHYYPPKPRRRRRQRPAYRHTPSKPGDIRPGTPLWVRPGGLHPGWGDIHQWALLTDVDTPTCGIWLLLDSTLHRVRPEHLTVDTTPIRNAARAEGTTLRHGPRRPLLPEWEWLNWTVAQHLAHDQQHPAPVGPEPTQEHLF
ncbi:hypothetical protein [Streptomyces luteireticuli]|uniref:Uncharacterized protein n=1 Tax=Streptomyces luteireticuli TaxID=173858 RepID=A0ABN0Z9Y4_9ACTN